MSREEPHIVFALVDLCKQLGVRCVVQVGAEDGYEAEEIRKATGCQAVCFEPDPKCAPVSLGLGWHPIMIGATDCMTNFYVHVTRGLSSQISRAGGLEEKVEMQQRRLDTFCLENGIAPDVLLVDTEGTTLDVLEGAGALLDAVRLVYAECQTHEIRLGMRLLPEVAAFLAAREFVQRTGAPAYDAGGQGNYCWVRP